MTDTSDLRAQIADAITSHPGNRTGTPEQRHPVSLLLADAALQAVTPELERLTEERDGAYRERAQLLAYLAAAHESHIGYTDPDVPTWPVLTVEAPTGQMCWHINPADLDLFGHVPQVDPVAIGWDGHTTEEKYQRLAALVSATAEEADRG
jgi:hypothetical protein